MNKQLFSIKALENAYTQEINSRNILIYINPQDFLRVAMSGHSEEKSNHVKNLVINDVQFNEIPFLNFVHDGEGTARVTGHEGRHRAKILIELGIDEMPVILRHVYDENGQAMVWNKMNTTDNQFYDMWPERLYGERGSSEETNKHSKNYIDFPIKDLRLKLTTSIKLK